MAVPFNDLVFVFLTISALILFNSLVLVTYPLTYQWLLTQLPCAVKFSSDIKLLQREASLDHIVSFLDVRLLVKGS